MSYYMNIELNGDFSTIVNKTIDALQNEGFGVLTEIDIDKKFKEKLNIDFRKYKILGACAPSFAYKALLAEDKIGILLPCNLVIQEKENGQIDVAVVDPIESMKAVQNEKLNDLAIEIKTKLENVIKNLKQN